MTNKGSYKTAVIRGNIRGNIRGEPPLQRCQHLRFHSLFYPNCHHRHNSKVKYKCLQSEYILSA